MKKYSVELDSQKCKIDVIMISKLISLIPSFATKINQKSLIVVLILVFSKVDYVKFFNPIVRFLALVFLKLFAIRYFKFTGSNANKIIKKITSTKSEMIRNYYPEGLIYGSGYIGYASNIDDLQNNNRHGGKDSSEISILGLQSMFSKVIVTGPSLIKLDMDNGLRHGSTPTETELDLSSYIPRPNQICVVNRIINHFKTHGHAVCYLWGEPGVGKSTISLLVAKELNAKICFDIDPIERHSDGIFQLHSYLDPTKDNPLIIVIEEVDSVLEKVHYSTQFYLEKMKLFGKKKQKQQHTFEYDSGDETSDTSGEKKYNEKESFQLERCEWSCKKNYNTCLDKINNNWFKNLILIMTSNQNVEYINNLDSSYLRENRVNICTRVSL